jgi:hypothetical protein
VIGENNGNAESTAATVSKEKWRVEVKSTVTFETVSDHKWIKSFTSELPQRGYGPQMEYLKKIYEDNGFLGF